MIQAEQIGQYYKRGLAWRGVRGVTSRGVAWRGVAWQVVTGRRSSEGLSPSVMGIIHRGQSGGIQQHAGVSCLDIIRALL